MATGSLRTEHRDNPSYNTHQREWDMNGKNDEKKWGIAREVSPHLRVIKQPIAESVAGWLKKAGRVVWAAASTAAGL